MMKVLFAFCLVLAFVRATSARMLTQNGLGKVLSIASLTVLASESTTPIADVIDTPDFSGFYDDANHPNCLREVGVSGTTAYVRGTDGNPGCPPDGSGTPWKLTGMIVDNGDALVVDFSPKGGPSDLKGVYETTPIPGIRWSDGNLWSAKSASQ